MIFGNRIVQLQKRRILAPYYYSTQCWVVEGRDCHQHQYQYQQCQKKQQQQHYRRCLSSSSRSSSTGNSNIIITTSNKKTTVWERQAIAIKDIDSTRLRTTPTGTQHGNTNKQQSESNSTTNSSNKYIETLRDIHDPTLHIKTIEDELIGTIGKALGKQGEKIIMLLKLMKEEYTNYNTLLNKIQQSSENKYKLVHTKKDERNNNNNVLVVVQVKECIKKYNQYRTDAIQARWELIVHRQAAGFITQNHQYIMKHYPIPDTILEIPKWLLLKLIEQEVEEQEEEEQQEQKEEEQQQQQQKEESNNDYNENTCVSTETTTKKIWTDQFEWWDKIGRWK